MQIACRLTDKNLQHNKKTIKICQLGLFDFTRKLYNVHKQINIVLIVSVCKTW